MSLIRRHLFFISFLLFSINAIPQRVFHHDILLKYTPVKDQSNSSTCWSFATTSFVESELLRTGKGEFDLSEMFFVWHIYPQKAENYVRWHGNVFLTPGGQPHDVMKAIKDHGLITQQAYRGKTNYAYGYDHSEMDTLINKEARMSLEQDNISGFEMLKEKIFQILITYIGEPPASFEYENKKYNSLEFSEYLNFHAEDYIELTSYTHHAFYKAFILETRYNWSHDLYHNLPYKEFFETIDQALKKGFTVLWNGDVSETGFSFDYGMALVPEKNPEDKTALEQKNTFLTEEKEIIPTPEVRQQTFESLESKVDHVMHIVGTAHDQDEKKYYIVKNSWGINGRTGGLIYMSDAYLKLKTISVMVHKDAIPKNILNKLQL